MKTFLTLIKRELWEHQFSFVRLPALFGGILILISLCAMVFSFIHSGSWQSPAGMDPHSAQWQASPLNLQHHTPSVALAFLFYSVGGPFIVIMWLVIANYFLGAFYDDRKDKSILFWHSMPISQTQFVLAKLVSGLVLVPIATLICIIITEFLSLGISSITLAVKGVPFWPELWSPLALLTTLATQVVAIAKQIIWLFPFVGWFMFCSSFAKKAPSLRAIMPIIILIIVEAFLIPDHGIFRHFIWNHLAAATHAWTSGYFILGVLPQLSPEQQAILQNAPMPWTSLLSGLAIGLIFIFGSGFLRHRHYAQ